MATKFDAPARQFHKENPEVWDQLVKYVKYLSRIGLKKASIWLVMNQIRWNKTIKKKEEFLISNNYFAWYSRRFMRKYPEFDGFFETRKRKHDAKSKGKK